MSSILEAIRLLHEEVEVLEKAGAAVLDNKPSAQFGALFAEARVAAYAQRVRQLSSRLLSLYQDADAAKRVEAATLSSSSHMTTFHERLGVIRSAPAGAAAVSGSALAAGAALGAASAGPSADAASVLGPIDSAVELSLRRLFAPEEVFGRYVDLQAAGLFDSWGNLPLIREARAAAARAGGATSSAPAEGSSAAGFSVAALVAGFRGGAAPVASGSSSSFGSSVSSAAPASLPLGAATLDYPAFLSRLAELHTTLPAKVKLSRQYRRHVASLAGALLTFYSRTHPLLDAQEDLLQPIAAAFAARWADALTGRGPTPFGWATAMRAAASGVGAAGADDGDAGVGGADGSSSSSSRMTAGAPVPSSSAGSSAAAGSAAASGRDVDLTSFASQAAMEAALGHDGIKGALSAKGLKVGGTPADRASRLWSVRGLARDQIPKKLLAATAAGAAASGASASSSAAAGAADAMDTDDSAGAAAPAKSGAAAAAAPAAHAGAAAGTANATGSASSLSGAVDAVFAPVDVHSYYASHVAPAVTAALATALQAAGKPDAASAAAAVALPPWLPAAWCEEAALRGAALLRTELEASVRRLDRRATRTPEEWAGEREAEEAEALASAGIGIDSPPGAAGAAAASGAAGSSSAGAGMLPLIAAGGVRLDEGDDDDDDDGGAAKYASNIVLGEDGKPLPYWLYRLHGLNISYACEICGGESYRGRRAFDRHFQEWRHAYGMRCLGIPNTKHFHDITKIADALALWERLRTDTATESFRADIDEEFEDSAGNVLTRRTYDDLARQGML